MDMQCPFFVIANIPLCPFNPTTGSTEFWLGSHASTSGQQQIIATPELSLSNAKLRVGEPTCNVLPEVVEARRKIRPPIQLICEKGDIILRDLRTWHAGMPNESEDYRIMLALGYQVRLLNLQGILKQQLSSCLFDYYLFDHERLLSSPETGSMVPKSHSAIQASFQSR